ncbi:MAG: hypothetical protein II839_11385 [Kiritimatiellae bacterium]|nr:hypothetical protein [Kiritimatiellia bacterium]
MTKQLLLAGAAAMFATAASAVSQIPNDGTIENYAIIATDMSGLHGGVQGRIGERTLSQKNGFEGVFDLNRVDAYLGYDLCRWLTVYGFVGIADAKSDDFFEVSEGDTKSTYGGGLWAALIDDDQLDIMSTFSRFRLNFGAEYAYTDANDLSIGETDVFLTFELLNDMFLIHEMYPSSIGLFAGPVFSMLDADGYEQDEDDRWGLTVGLSMTFSRRVYVNGGIDIFPDDHMVYASAGVRF